MTAPRILIVGAGPAGLATARRLRERGLAFDHVERHTAVGGLWDIDNPWTPMYESASFISSKTLSHFPDHPFPADTPDYPRRADLAAYLRGFAAAHGLAEGIEFGTSVEAVVPDGAVWRVRLGSGEERTYDAVVAATGMLQTPIQPALPGEFTGAVEHTMSYREPSRYAGQRVLVVGCGNSGADIAAEIGEVAASTTISMRRGYWFIPKHLFGVPVDVFGQSGPKLPLKLEQGVFGAILRAKQGNLAALGLPRPDHKLFETHPLVNDTLLAAIRAGRVTPRPGIASVSGRTVTFTDGSSTEVDTWLWATGYTHTIPVFGDLVGDGHMPDLWLQTFSREHAGLLAVGFIETNSGAWAHFDRQARMVAGHLADQRDRPSAASAFRDRIRHARPDLTGGIGFVDTPRHEGYVDTHAFAELADRALAELGW